MADNQQKLGGEAVDPPAPLVRYALYLTNLYFKTAHLVAKWMSVGFTHGVLNTDNLSLASITIDYGPFGFLDSYDPNFIPNHSDDGGRYDYESQPSICLWNLGRLAVALTPILSSKFSKTINVLTN